MKRSVKLIIGLVIVLVIARLLLPYVVLRYVNRQLADMGAYTGHIDDVDIALLRGAYQIKELQIRKLNNKLKEPFLFIPKTDLSVQWNALLKGKLVGEVETYQPELNVSFSKDETERQTGEEVDWTLVVKDLLPIQINRFAVVDGQIDLTSFISSPQADLSLQRCNAEIRNIRNVEASSKALPSPVWATGDVPGYGGTLRLDANMFLLKQVPDFDYNLRFTDLDMVKLNKITREYANLDFERGRLSIVSEMAMKDGQLNGYVKPLTKGMKIFKMDENENRSVGKFFTELLAQGGVAILKNQKKDQVATRIPLSGTIENVRSSFWPTFFGVLQNAYVQAFENKFDDDISFTNAVSTIKDNFKSGRAERKAAYKNKREERRAARKERRARRKAERQQRREARRK